MAKTGPRPRRASVKQSRQIAVMFTPAEDRAIRNYARFNVAPQCNQEFPRKRDDPDLRTLLLPEPKRRSYHFDSSLSG